MIEAMFWGFVLRFVQAVTSASPFIVIGFLVAAVFRVQLGASTTRRLFGEAADPAAPRASKWQPLLRAWAIGMLLPVCSLGAIPIARELKRIGLPAGTILAFAMTAPLFNPLSLLYGLTLSEPIAILGFAGCSLVIVTVLGYAFDRIFPGQAEAAALEESIAPGWRRIVANGTSMLRDMVSVSSTYILIGLLGVSLLGAILPTGSMQVSLEADDPMAIPRMLGMAIPVYATPMLAMSQLGMMFSHVNSIGSAFVLLVLGAGMNLGLLAWMIRQYGLGKSAVWFALLIGVVVVLAYSVDKPLTPKGVEPAGHTHAFDIYCRPFRPGDAPKPVEFVTTKLERSVQPYEWQTTYVLAALLAAGLLLRLVDRQRKLDHWLASAEVIRGKYDVWIPPSILGGAVLLILIALSVVGCFAYYPPAEEVFEEMTIARGEALSGAISGDVEHAVYWISVFDDWTRKLEVGTYLRTGNVTEFQRMKGWILREKLELLEHEVEDLTGAAPLGSPVRHLTTDVMSSYSRLRTAYNADRRLPGEESI